MSAEPRSLPPPAGATTFGATLRALRRARGWSARQVAGRAGVNKATVGRAERGNSPRPATVLALAGALGLAGDDRRRFLAVAPLYVGGPRPSAGASPFAVLLRRRREAAGLSQSALARRAGCHTSAVNRHEEKAVSFPTRALVTALADALDLEDEETDDLLLAAGHLPSWSTDVTVRQCAALLARLPGPAARRLRGQIAAAWERDGGAGR